MVGVGLIGLGEIGQVHLAGLRESAHVGPVTVCDLDADLMERSRGDGRVASSLDELLADDDIEVVDICLPHHLHASHALRALAAGRHVLLEKPMAMSVAECDQILAVAADAGRSVGVSHNQLFYEPHRRLAGMLERGDLGDVLTIRARLAIGGKYGGWRSNPAQAGGGLLMDAGVHRVYVLEALGGPITAVTAVMDRPGSEDRYSILFEFATGAIGTIDATYGGPAGLFDDQIEVVGTEAIARVAGCEALFEGFATGPALRVWRNGTWTERDSANDWAGSVKVSVDAFCAAVANGTEPPVTGADGRRIVQIIEAAYASAREGIRVEIDSSRFDLSRRSSPQRSRISLPPEVMG
ncbi:MAG: Gfo/Idh/MocA family oxidoreductase [Actinobacteria bacterium]|nr:Gfo/Idh/MocA family oxidoreductase [Actinomycetota bacterium]